MKKAIYAILAIINVFLLFANYGAIWAIADIGDAYPLAVAIKPFFSDYASLIFMVNLLAYYPLLIGAFIADKYQKTFLANIMIALIIVMAIFFSFNAYFVYDYQQQAPDYALVLDD